jgi:serine/threonine protein kinase
LLGRWKPPDRSSESVAHPPSPDRLSELLRQNSDPQEPLTVALEHLKASTPAPVILDGADPAWFAEIIPSVDSSVMKLTLDSKSNPITVRRAQTTECAELIRREAAILGRLKHPLVLEISETAGPIASIVTPYAGQGSLADHLTAESGLRRPNRIAKVVAGIALAMRFVHSRAVTHSNLCPASILLDWNWSVRITGFRGNTSPDALWSSPGSRYFAPECHGGTFIQASDVFAFGLILLEMLTGGRAFPVDLHYFKIAWKVVEGDMPRIPDSVPPPARELITDCWADDFDERPTFAAIVDRLRGMEFKVMANVNSAKLAAFVEKIEEWEICHLEE